MSDLANVVIIGRREMSVRMRTRSFRLGTVALVIGVLLLAMAPVIVRWIEGSSTTNVAVWAEPGAMASDPAATLTAMLNAPATPAAAGGEPAARYVVSAVPDVATGRTGVAGGTYGAFLVIRRGADGELAFTLYTNEPASGRGPQLAQQVATTLAVQDRLIRAGVQPAAQASLFTRAPLTVLGTDPNAETTPKSAAEEGASALLGVGLSVLILMMIVLYGTWVAMSVVEEKSSRVMEVILNAATPFQLLTGKVLGVGSVALLQYTAILLAGAVALLLQGPVTSLLLGGDSAGISLPAGLTPGILAMLVVYGILGFLLYAVLYAAAGSLVSRQEDVNAVTMPMSMLAMTGYFVAIYSGLGTINVGSTWMAILSLFPFTSPFVMLSRAMQGTVEPWEIVLSIVILAASVVGALWMAARLYAAGVLLYGQRPSVRRIWKLVRAGA